MLKCLPLIISPRVEHELWGTGVLFSSGPQYWHSPLTLVWGLECCHVSLSDSDCGMRGLHDQNETSHKTWTCLLSCLYLMFMSVFRVMIMSALHLMSMKSIQTGNQSSENMNLHLLTILILWQCITLEYRQKWINVCIFFRWMVTRFSQECSHAHFGS